MRQVFRCIGTAAAIAVLATTAAFAQSVAVRLPSDAAQRLDALSLQPVRDFDYGSFRWLELEPADLARLAASGVAYELEADALQVRVGAFAFDPIAGGEPALAPGLEAAASGPGFRLVQFGAPVRDEWRSELERAGALVLQYYPHHTYLVWSDDAAAARVAGLAHVRWLGSFHPAYKPHADLAGRRGRIENVDVHFFSGPGVDKTLAQLESLGARVLGHHAAQPDGLFWDAIVELPAAAVTDVARLPQVLWLGYESPRPVLDDEMSDQIVAGNYTAGVPFVGYEPWLTSVGLDGTGVIWAIVDTGVDYDHPDLGSHIVGGYDFPGACVIAGQPGTDCPSGGHGTHVAGIVGGDATGGFTDPGGFLYGLGVAPSYSIFAMNSLSAAAWPPAGGWQEHSKRAVLGGALGGNNSWTTGEGTAHGYQASERTHDLMVRDGNFDTAAVAEPLIEVFSAGNSGPGASTLTSPKEAKNLIIVAASRNFRVGSIDTLASFSSRGPAVDGRHGITIATPGEQIASSVNDTGGSCASPVIPGTSNLYAYCSGTSMAAPHASGAVVMAADWWRGFNAGADPSPAMAKALLVNSAVDMGTPDIPNTNEGWGRVHLGNLFDATVNRVFIDQDELFGAAGEFREYTWGVPDTGRPLKITVAWADAAGAVGANPALVNNLNLTVTTGGNTYLGNVFAAGWSTTGGTVDVKNNIENVYVQNPGGSVTIRIDAANVPGDGVPYNGDPTDQDFALVCTNCVEAADFSLDATPGALDVCAPANAVITVNVGSLLGFANPVTLAATGTPPGASVGFSSNPVTPPGTSTLTIGNTGGATPGQYTVSVDGTASGSAGHSDAVALGLYSASPGAPTLTSPANGAINVPAVPVFTWTGGAQSGTYTIEVATDAAFSNVVASASDLTDATWTSNVTLNTSTPHFWRVRADNACGTGANSTIFTFTTVAAPGDCAAGSVPNVLYDYGFEGGAGGWTSSGTGNTWAIAASNPHSGTSHFHANDPSAVSDQRLVSPAGGVALPTGEDPVVLKFWHVPDLEPSGSTACYDGGILEISTDGGATFNQVPGANLLVGGYRGTVSSSFGNPLAGLSAWCGTTSYLNTIADLTAWAGQTVQFRMRLGSDSSVSDPGWDVDDVMVQSCTPDIGGMPFFGDFETGDTSQWSSVVP